MKQRIFFMVVGFCMLTIFCVAGCGDNGGETDESNQPPYNTSTPTPAGTTVNLTKFKGIVTGTDTGSEYSFPSLNGTDSLGRAWTGSHSLHAYGLTTFESQSVTKSISVTVFQFGGPPPYSSDLSTRYYLASDGSFYKADSDYRTIPLSQSPFPTTPKVGESGSIGIFKNNNGTTTTVSWALNPDVNGASQFVTK